MAALPFSVVKGGQRNKCQLKSKRRTPIAAVHLRVNIVMSEKCRFKSLRRCLGEIGDGLLGRRSERLGMPHLFETHDLSKWYQKDIHLRVKMYFKSFFPGEMIRVSKDEAFPIHKHEPV